MGGCAHVCARCWTLPEGESTKSDIVCMRTKEAPAASGLVFVLTKKSQLNSWDGTLQSLNSTALKTQ